jgi:thiol-disulfide isomerase/thioredoxin
MTQNSTNSNKNAISTKVTEQIPENDEVLGFNFYDENGNNYVLNDFSDKPIMLILWSSDSTNALDIIELAQEYYEKDEFADSINFLAVNTNEPDSELKEHIENVFTLPIYYDTTLSAYNEYEFSNLPYLIFIDKNGEISNTLNPNETGKELTADSLEANLELLIYEY